MNGRAQAEQAVRDFFLGTQRYLFLDGTFQNEKHRLVLAQAFSVLPPPVMVLFRIHAHRHLESLLRPLGLKPPAAGKPTRVGPQHLLYADTKNATSWNKTPKQVDIAVLYPLDAFSIDDGTGCVDDLLQRGAKKIALVTWTDNKDFSWVDQYEPVRVTFDSEEERPDYHERMQEHVGGEAKPEVPRNLPKYAEGTDAVLLVSLDCRNCKTTRWAEMNVPYPGKVALADETAGYEAKCLKCRHVDHYSSTWYGRE